MPFLRALIPLIAGTQCYGSVPPSVAIRIFLTATGILMAFSLVPVVTRFRLRHFRTLAFLVLVSCLGYTMAFMHDARNSPLYIGNGQAGSFMGVISSEPTAKTNGSSFILQVISLRGKGNWSPANGLVQAFARNGRFAQGDTLLVLTAPGPVKTANKGYYQYLVRKNIRYSVSLRPGNHFLMGRQNGQGIVGRIRKNFLATIDTLFPDRNERAMASALLLGYRADMDPELLSAYTNTGVVHVIAVSGMHLALIYGLVSLLLRPMKDRRTKQARTLVIIALLWLFALLCGASPSVTRSALMFSFMLCADVFRNEHQPLNTLAGSAFILVCADPSIVSDIGFQLSYAAVASLMAYSAPITQLLQPENPILRYAWATIATTLSAQILTTPLTLLHFGQFPLLFLPANIIAIPLSGIILILLILACILQPLGAAALPAWVSAHLIRFLNETISGLGNTRFATLQDINIHWYDAVNIYIIIMALTRWIRSKK